MKHDAVRLSDDERVVVEDAIRELAARYRWTVHSIASQSDHVHVVITANREGEPLRDALKATATRALNQRYGKRVWWAEGGSAKYLWEWGYFQNAIKYVKDQRDF
jgi:REP element-mobilizing transposase RayT